MLLVLLLVTSTPVCCRGWTKSDLVRLLCALIVLAVLIPDSTEVLSDVVVRVVVLADPIEVLVLGVAVVLVVVVFGAVEVLGCGRELAVSV
jgi:hypothetical protein